MRMLPILAGGLAAGVALTAAVPVFAQASSEEITVMGRYGRVPDSVRSLSQAVSYADLDLSTKAGRDELRRRVNLTARYLCERLGETDTSSAVVPSCRDGAVRDAMQRVGTVEQGFAPRGTTWVASAPWAPPYPAEWVKRYPLPDEAAAPAYSPPSGTAPPPYTPPAAVPPPAYSAPPAATPPQDYSPRQPRG